LRKPDFIAADSLHANGDDAKAIFECWKSIMALLKVDPDLCIGCALCVELCPDVFEIRENKAWIIPPKLFPVTEKVAVVKNTGDCEACDCVLVVDTCPTAAISLVKKM